MLVYYLLRQCEENRVEVPQILNIITHSKLNVGKKVTNAISGYVVDCRAIFNQQFKYDNFDDELLLQNC